MQKTPSLDSEISLKIPVTDEFDVLVAGGGPAGCAAAVAAAREGARTLLVEAAGCLGGMGTAGLVPAWMPWHDGERPVVRGLAERVILECFAGMPHADISAHKGYGPIDAELLKRIYDDLIEEADVSVLFNTQLVATRIKECGVDSVVLANKSGLTACRAKVFVDCTGDADLAVSAGARFLQGDPETGELMPVTHCFVIANVDQYGYQYSARRKWGETISAIINSGKYPDIPDRHSCNELLGPGTIGFNAGHQWDVDNTDPSSVSKALIKGRRIARAYHEALKENFPEAFSNSFLVNTGSLMGIREGRRIIGDYILTMDDYIARRSFSDEICRNHYPVDIHTAKHEVEADRAGRFNVMDRCEHYKKGESHGIPYRCLCPDGVPNVLVAGRSVSCERPVQSSIRIMPICIGMGEAAGLAAALAADADFDVHRVNAGLLRERLRKHGGYLPEIEICGECK